MSCDRSSVSFAISPPHSSLSQRLTDANWSIVHPCLQVIYYFPPILLSASCVAVYCALRISSVCHAVASRSRACLELLHAPPSSSGTIIIIVVTSNSTPTFTFITSSLPAPFLRRSMPRRPQSYDQVPLLFPPPPASSSHRIFRKAAVAALDGILRELPSASGTFPPSFLPALTSLSWHQHAH